MSNPTNRAPQFRIDKSNTNNNNSSEDYCNCPADSADSTAPIDDMMNPAQTIDLAAHQLRISQKIKHRVLSYKAASKTVLQNAATKVANRISMATSPQPQGDCAPQCAAPSTISTAHYRQQLSKQRQELRGFCDSDEAQLNLDLNIIFLERLEEIDNAASGDTNLQLRLVTYQEWVDLLLHINNFLINNISNMQTEANQLITECHNNFTTEQQDAGEVNRKLRKDMCQLIKIIQNAYQRKCWNFDEIHLETVKLEQVLGSGTAAIHNTPPSTLRPLATSTTTSASAAVTAASNLCDSEQDLHLKALASEIGEKYDEISKLRCKVASLENEIQVAHQKIILKDEAMAYQRERLDQLEAELEDYHRNMDAGDSCVSQDKLKEALRSKLNAIYLGLRQQERIEMETMNTLKREITEMVQMNCAITNESWACFESRVTDLFKKVTNRCDDHQNSLKNLREQIINLDGFVYNPAQASRLCQQSEEFDLDRGLIEMLQMRLCLLNERNNKNLMEKQSLEFAHQELQCRFDADQMSSKVNVRVLKEIAELICELRREDFHYECIYDKDSTENPFCESIMDIYNLLQLKLEQKLKAEAEATTTTHVNNI